MSELVKKLPKIELHCHLDGSVAIHTLEELCRLNGKVITKQELLAQVVAPEVCKDLAEYLSCFPLTTSLLDHEWALVVAVLSVVQQAADENVKYMEIRFSPEYVSTGDFTMEEAIQAVLKGKQLAETVFPVRLGILICLMRGRSDEVNRSLLDLAKKYKAEGVVGVDLAGNEAKYPMHLYRELFSYAKQLELPFTIHAGETGNFENIREAVEAGAKRIGHGIALQQQLEYKAVLQDKKVTLEMCPVCNIQTGAADSFAVYPFDVFRKSGVLVSVNTDNRTVSNTSLTRELLTLHHFVTPLRVQDVKELMLNALEAAFIEDEIKQQLKEEMEQEYAQFDIAQLIE